MSKQVLIHSNSFGYVSKCTCCLDFQMCLGNVVLNFERDDFEQFKQDFFSLNELKSCPLHRTGSVNRYSFKTGLSDLSFSLTKNEFTLVTDLFNMTSLDGEISACLFK